MIVLPPTCIANLYDLELGFPGNSVVKNSLANAGDASSIPGLGRSPGEGMTTTPVFLPGDSHGQGGEPGGLQSMVAKSWT